MDSTEGTSGIIVQLISRTDTGSSFWQIAVNVLTDIRRIQEADLPKFVSFAVPL
ncbi:hypothetical protein [Paenibacillus zeisoli]|uniref:hypothetical protein n=1 Tax=Paenibacillus zeisoli TaxID=2496267 RepID=UPI00163B9CD7|nr:hypothetical protein [Paenibacillus zeisoli]